MRRWIMVSLACGLLASNGLTAQESDGLTALEATTLGLRVIVEEDTGGILSATSLRSSAIVLLTQKLPEVQIDEESLLTLYVQPECVAVDGTGGYACSFTVSLEIRLQDLSPWNAVAASMVYWSVGHLMLGDNVGNANRLVKEWFDLYLDEPVAEWLTLSEESRACWREYFNANARYAPLSPCE